METPEDILQHLKDNDTKTLGMRASRMAEVISISYEGIYTPTVEYLKELDKLYVNGYFMATVIFAATIIEHILRHKLYPVANRSRVDKAGLGTLCTMAVRMKVLSKNEVDQLRLVNKMRNTVIHTDVSFAQELMSWANPEISDP